MKNKYRKVNIRKYIDLRLEEFKKFKNIEKLKIVKELEEKRKEDKAFFLCVNQNGKELIKSDFMLEYGYTKLSSGAYVPRDNKIVFACQVDECIEFAQSFGEGIKLNIGDYIVMNKQNKIIIGMKKDEFEENYKSVYKANKIMKNYLNETLNF